MKSGQKVRMEDVVALSGLSRSTVDRVLNGRAGVRKETAIKVEKALRDLRYRESSLKRHIVDNLEKVEVLLSDGSNPFFHSVSEAFHSIGDMPEMQLFDIKYRGFDIYDHRTRGPPRRRSPPSAPPVAVAGVDERGSPWARSETRSRRWDGSPCCG